MQESRNNIENGLKQKSKHSQEDVGILEKKAKVRLLIFHSISSLSLSNKSDESNLREYSISRMKSLPLKRKFSFSLYRSCSSLSLR